MGLLVLLCSLMLLCSLPAPVAAQSSERSPALDRQYRRAETAWKSGGSLLEAKARLDRVLEARPSDHEALKLRARVLLLMERPEEALRDAQQAVAVAPQDGEAHLILSQAARLSGRRELAVAELDRAAEHIRTGAALHVRLSWNAAMLGQMDRAEAFARIALAQDPSHAGAYYQLARVFVAQGEEDKAATTLERGLRALVLEPAVIRQDPVLRQVAGHELLSAYLPEP